MPHILISNRDDIPKYARVDRSGKSMVWTTIDQATGYASAQDATKAFDDACSAMLLSAKTKRAKAIAEGCRIDIPYAGEAHLFGADGQFIRRASSDAALFAPVWLLEGFDPDHPELHRAHFPLGARPTPMDLLGVFETFYARTPKGWLARPQKKYLEGRLQLDGPFALAVPFSSQSSAENALLNHGATDGWVVKTSCVFTAISTMGRPVDDEVAGSIRSACEARDIETSLIQSARDRIDDLNANSERKPRRI